MRVAAEAPTGSGEWLTLAELTERTGRTPAAVRSWMRRRRKEGRLRVQRNNRGETQIWATAEHLMELGRGRDPGDDRTGDPGDDPAVTGLLEEVAELRHTLGRAEGELEAERRHSASLAGLLAEERVRADQLRAEHRITVAELRAELAEERRPWLAKVLEGMRRKG